MIVKVKEKFEKTRHVKNIFHEDKEMTDIMKEFYLIKRNLIISLESILRHEIV